jgi:SM-20-related protein
MTDTKIMQLDFPYESILRRIKHRYENSMFFGWKANAEASYDQGHWHKPILSSSKSFLFDHNKLPFMQEHPEVKYVWDAIQKNIGPQGLYEVYVNGYTFGTDGYAHRDAYSGNNFEPVKTIIVYLNDQWNKDYAGETVLFDEQGEITQSVLPKFGRCFMFPSNLFHAARPVSRIFPGLRSVLVFKTMDAEKSSKAVDFLVEKTKGYEHSGRTFLNHLFGTMALLEKHNLPKEVCQAGLFHSIYGTEYYKFIDPSITREVVQGLIPKYSEELAYEFCYTPNRTQSFLKNEKGYSKEMRQHLLHMEAANLSDQNQTGRFSEQIKQIVDALRE